MDFLGWQLWLNSTVITSFCRQQVLCISTSFLVLRAPESWLKHFLRPFSTSFVHFKHFSTFFLDFSQKIIETHLKKQCFKLLFKAGLHANAGRLPGGYLEFIFFRLLYSCFPNSPLNPALSAPGTLSLTK